MHALCFLIVLAMEASTRSVLDALAAASNRSRQIRLAALPLRLQISPCGAIFMLLVLLHWATGHNHPICL